MSSSTSPPIAARDYADLEAGHGADGGQSSRFTSVLSKLGAAKKNNATTPQTTAVSPTQSPMASSQLPRTSPRSSQDTTLLPAPVTFSERVKLGTNALKKRVGYLTGGKNEDEEDAQEPYDDATRQAIEKAKYDKQVIDLLDVIDPEVSALSTLSDLQNSLFVPNLGRFVDRTAYRRRTQKKEKFLEEETEDADAADEAEANKPHGITRFLPFTFTKKHASQAKPPTEKFTGTPTPVRPGTVTEPDPDADDAASVVSRREHLVMPNGLVPDWDEWSNEEKEELDDYVRHLLHSKKWKARRGWRGFKHYASTPLGAFVTTYASLLTVFGATWVLLLIGWLSAGDRQNYIIEIIDEVLVALFCVVGIGLAPFRAVDTYHMIYIAKYHRKTLRLYRERGIPAPPDENDLPRLSTQPTEEGKVRPPVLSVEEQAMLVHHQTRFSRSHTFYRPHETSTHKAFPLDLLIVVVCLLDFHSLFQIALGSTTWSISYHRSFKHILTSIILSFSICCNISGGIVIAVGNRRSRKTEVVEERLRVAVTEEAVRRREAKLLKQEEERIKRETGQSSA